MAQWHLCLVLSTPQKRWRMIALTRVSKWSFVCPLSSVHINDCLFKAFICFRRFYFGKLLPFYFNTATLMGGRENESIFPNQEPPDHRWYIFSLEFVYIFGWRQINFNRSWVFFVRVKMIQKWSPFITASRLRTLPTASKGITAPMSQPREAVVFLPCNRRANHVMIILEKKSNTPVKYWYRTMIWSICSSVKAKTTPLWIFAFA